MKGNGRRLVWVSVVVVVAIAALAWFLTRSSERPEYVKAAKELSAARAEARNMFGDLTWADYSKSRRLPKLDNTKAWTDIRKLVPNAAVNHDSYVSRTSGLTYKSIFESNKATFGTLSTKLSGIAVRHGAGYTDARWAIPAKNIIKGIAAGIVGAADAGDVGAVRDLTKAGREAVHGLNVEPDFLTFSVSVAGNTMLDDALLTALVRHRHDRAMLKTVREGIVSRPVRPDIVDAIGGEARLDEVLLTYARTEPVDNVIKELQDVRSGTDYASSKTAKPTLIRRIAEFFGSLRIKSGESKYGAGQHTMDAFEARYLQVSTELARKGEAAIASRPYDRSALLKLKARVEGSKDPSYSFVQSSILFEAIDRWVEQEFEAQAATHAVEIIARYPELSNLPQKLPPDLSFADPFSKGDVIYKKTPTGFILYSPFLDRRDDGFKLAQPSRLTALEAKVMRSDESKDIGLVINYKPTAPIP